MKKIFDHYRKTLIFNPDKYLYCCEDYDVGILTEKSYDMFVFDQIYSEYHRFIRGHKCDPIWKELSHNTLKEIKTYLDKEIECLK